MSKRLVRLTYWTVISRGRDGSEQIESAGHSLKREALEVAQWLAGHSPGRKLVTRPVTAWLALALPKRKAKGAP